MQSAKPDPDQTYGPLLSGLESRDESAQLKALQLLTISLGEESTNLQNPQIQPLLPVVATLLQSSSPKARDVAVQFLEALLSRPDSRNAVWAQARIMKSLIDIAKSNVSPQMNYQVAFCFWILSFDPEIARVISKKYDIVNVLTKVAKTAVKEKVIRVIVATFRNLLAHAPQENLPFMLVAQLLPFIRNLLSRKWADEEILEDLQFLRDELTKGFESLSTYDEYVSELASGHLSWSPVHESESFWRENATKLNESDHKQLRVLVQLILASQDPTVLAVAAHDLGKYVKYSESGKRLITELGGKAKVMELMGHENPDVRFQALVTVQRLVSNAWAAQ